MIAGRFPATRAAEVDERGKWLAHVEETLRRSIGRDEIQRSVAKGCEAKVRARCAGQTRWNGHLTLNRR